MGNGEEAPVSPPCPRCNVGLFAGKVGHLDALGCGACGGLWVDNEATTTILRRYDLDAAQLARMIDARAAAQQALSPFATASGGCPICTKPLEAAEHQGTRLDFCALHGTFFDRGELARVLERAKLAAVPVAAPPAGPSIGEIRTEIRHEAAWRNDPLGTALLDWATGGQDWVNKWRR
jgi:Zn-finger nucleic acid-binding protein